MGIRARRLIGPPYRTASTFLFMISRCTFAAVVVAVALAVPASAVGQTMLTPSWTRVETGYTTDTIALGDVSSAPGDELVVMTQGSTWYGDPPTQGTGKVVVLRTNGALLNEFFPPAQRDIMGLPLIMQLDTGEHEYLMGEFVSPTEMGAVYANRGSSTTPNESVWIHTPRAWPGYWNMGPSAGNVVAGGGDEVVVADWNGIIQALDRRNGSPMATYDAFAAHGENLYGHVAIASVDNDAGNEIVVVGASTGQVIVLRAETDGTMTLLFASDPVPGGGFARGSGPAIGDIDGDGTPEIVVTTTGASPMVRAFDIVNNAAGPCKYQWTPAGSDFYWTSPVIGDVDGDGVSEVVVQDTAGRVHVMTTQGVTPSATGCVAGNYDVQAYQIGGIGGGSWFTPVVANLTGSPGLEIVVATYTTLEVVEVTAAGTAQAAYRAFEPTATFYPSAIVVPNGGGAALYVSGWQNGSVYRYDLSGTAPGGDWHSFMHNNRRTGLGDVAPLCDNGCDGGHCATACAPQDDCSVQCKSGCTCEIDCADTQNTCEVKCLNNASCVVDCTRGNNCQMSTCSGSSQCDFICDDANNCGITCNGQSSCNVDCVGGNNCEAFCKGQSNCNVDCTNANNCEKVECKGNAACTIDCTNANNCGFKTCSGGQMSCPGDIVVCNRACP